MANARNELAASIQTTVKTVTDNYVNSREFNNKEEIEERLKDKGPIWKIIAAEIEELYGISDDSFKYELKDDQYNVVLDSGEAMSLPCSYVDSLIQENN